jgi:ribosomal protein S1
MNEKELENFNWEIYTEGYVGGQKLQPNNILKEIKNTSKSILYSREPYVKELYNLYNNENQIAIKKDLEKGDYVKIVNIVPINESIITLELLGGLTIDVDLNREKKFLQLFGFENSRDFIYTVTNKEYLKSFLNQNLSVHVLETKNSLKISLLSAYIDKIKKEFMEQIKSPSKAYVAKINQANKGGFFVEVQGVEAFMPGSLAAPNKIIDFQTYVGKEVIVMVEDFLNEMNSFIVSHKKYVEHVLPKKLDELNLDLKYVGCITGTRPFGIFAEFEEICTGLLHVSKMKEDTLRKFNNREYKSGDTLEFYISEITKDNRIILTEESAEERKGKLNNFIEDCKDHEMEASIVAVMNFGLIIKIGEYSGLIPTREFIKRKLQIRNYNIGEKLKVKFLESNEDKLTFTLSD